MCRLPLDMGGGVRSCDLVDPYAVVLLVDGTVVLLELCEGGKRGEGEGEGEGEEEEEEGGARLQQTWPEIVKVRESLYVSSPVCRILCWREPQIDSRDYHHGTLRSFIDLYRGQR